MKLITILSVLAFVSCAQGKLQTDLTPPSDEARVSQRSGTGLKSAASPSSVPQGETPVEKAVAQAHPAPSSPSAIAGSELLPTVTILSRGFVNRDHDAAYRVHGTCSPTAAVVTIGGPVPTIATCQNGVFGVSIDFTGVSDGPLTVTAEAQSATGTVGTKASITLIKDTLAPVALLKETPSSSTRSPAYLFRIDASGMVKFKGALVDPTKPCSQVVFPNEWQVSPGQISGELALSDVGSKKICVIGMDEAKNVQPASEATAYTWEYLEPEASVTISNTGSINGSQAPSYIVQGQCSPNGTTVTIGGSVPGQTTCHNGSYQLGLDYSTVNDGPVSVTASVMQTAQASVQLTKDTVAPTVTLTSTPHISIASSNGASYPVSGSCSENGRMVTIGGTLTASAPCESGSFSTQLNFTSVSDGPFTITADLRDAANNAASQATLSRIKDLVAPVPGEGGLLRIRSLRNYSDYTRSSGGAARDFVNLSWSPANDNVDSAGSLQYEVRKGYGGMNTLAAVEGGLLCQAYTPNLTSLNDIDRSNSSVYLNVVVKDSVGNKAIYNSILPPQMPVTGQLNVKSLGQPSQRKSFYDALNERHWLFGFNGSQIVGSYSADNANWYESGILSDATDEYAVSHRVIAGTAYVFIVLVKNKEIVLRRGTLSANGVSFDAEKIVFARQTSADAYSRPNLALNADGHLWVAAVHRDGALEVEGFVAQVRRSTFLGNGDLSQWESVESLGSRTMAIQDLVILPRSGNQMFLVTNAPQMEGYAFNGAFWEPANNGGVASWTSFPTSRVTGTVRTAVARGGDLYIGGDFTSAGGVPRTAFIAKWDGSGWSPLGLGGMIGMGGSGSTYLSNTTYSGSVTALAFDSMGNLYAAGNFINIGGINASFLARWNGSVWMPLSTALSHANSYSSVSQWWSFPTSSIVSVTSIAIDSSDNIYIGGNFTNKVTSSSVPLGAGIVKYSANGSMSSLGSLTGGSIQVRALAWNSLTQELYAGGDFTNAAGSGVAYLAKWNGTSWSTVGSGGPNGPVYSLAVSGGVVYAGGSFSSPGPRIAKFDGTTWSALGSGADGTVHTILVDGSDVYIGGQFTTSPGVRVAKWNGTSWTGLGAGVSIQTPGLPMSVNSAGGTGTTSVLTLAKTASGMIYAGGNFVTASGVSGTANLAAWDGSQWSAVGPHGGRGMDGSIYAMVADGAGNIYMGGDFTYAGSVSARRIVKWDGSGWSALGTGMDSTVRALAWDSTANRLYAGGAFTSAGGVAASKVAFWNGSSWSAMGTGVTGGDVFAIAVVNSSNAVYVGGSFTGPGSYIARWNPSNTLWTTLDSGAGGNVYALLADPVSPGKLYVAGDFFSAPPATSSVYCARWSGWSWEALGTGCESGAGGGAYALATDGTNVYAATRYSGVKKWDGTSWTALTGTPTNQPAYALFWRGTNLYAAGNFYSTGASIAKWDGSTWSKVGSWGLGAFWWHYASFPDYPMVLDVVNALYVDPNNNVWAGGILGQADGWPTGHLAYLGSAPSSIARGGIKGISAVSDASGQIHIARANPEGITYFKYDGTTWSSTPITSTLDSRWSNPAISINDANGTLWILYRGAYGAVIAGRIFSNGSWSSAKIFNQSGTWESLNLSFVLDDVYRDSLVKVLTLDYYHSPNRIQVRTVH